VYFNCNGVALVLRALAYIAFRAQFVKCGPRQNVRWWCSDVHLHSTWRHTWYNNGLCVYVCKIIIRYCVFCVSTL